jgi:hypothetical protein
LSKKPQEKRPSGNLGINYTTILKARLDEIECENVE